MNERLNEILKAHTKEFEEVSDAIWEHPETRYQEFQSSRIQIEFLKERGFRLTEEIAGIKTAFVAEAGEGKPVIAFLGEFKRVCHRMAIHFRQSYPKEMLAFLQHGD